MNQSGENFKPEAERLIDIALTREVSPAIVNCELTHLEREPIDLSAAIEQHGRYEEALVALGCTLHRLPPLPDLPDSVFVEDTAIVLPELAIMTRPGAASRRPEVISVAEALGAYRSLAFIESPGTVDGGDVLVIGHTIYVGDSTRTNEEGVRQLARLTATLGYTVRSVSISGCLHLKSAVTRVGEKMVLLNPGWVDVGSFEGLEIIEVHPREPFGANAVLIGESILYAAGFDETQRRLETAGVAVRTVETTELQKAEGAVTCCSILASAKSG